MDAVLTRTPDVWEGPRVGPEPLLPRVAAGDAAAVRECLDRYGPLVWGLARRFLGNAADAEDATQDLFVELWRAAGKYDPGRASEPTFVAMLTRRRLIDRRRRFASRPDAGPLPDELAGVEALAQFEQDESAARLLDGLKDEERRVLVLSVCQGMSHSEVAEATGLPLGTVKSNIRRGLMRVRERLTGEGGRP